MLIDFTGVNCANCRTMEASVLPRPEVVKVLSEFITVQLYTLPTVPIASIDASQREAAQPSGTRLRELELTSENTNPLYVVLSPEGKVLSARGFGEPNVFVDFLNSALAKHKGAGKVAQSDPPARP
ncbi:MAG: hypothetical protein U0835_11600 [Isosphaeraceae bacterium]